ncbi:RagB/SusD family nutrient uptake outer membrane protein [Arenibacter sp. 6A1]|uniref:RagB/SusD family nutrient uptake outer membrane protein n=1 Tax=Arenibacter sp. 6A1 TaxID=2720391 RepID=UPI0014471187|nr:RagB/SusD family nutrient uptake outer membrane protein [Arenibacter sp. 6A1]NKI27587.1 RagB/SusD family nutrient uptake outer membrane protein [Arenibacter sp. 6A1]
MKSFIKNISFTILAILIIVGCEDEFLDRTPIDAVTEGQFFKSVMDLEAYTNGLYGYIGAGYNDLGSDNISHHNSGSDIEKLLRGDINQDNIGGWDWSGIRKVNFFMHRYQNVAGPSEDINHYVGVARFFRALLYYNKVKTYGDVPWYSKDLQTDDIELLYKAKDPRAMVVDSIMGDLEFAATNIKDAPTKTRITKWSALALLARIALHEGTYRKYHTELGLQDASRFLNRAATASKEIMDSGRFAIYTTGDYQNDYRDLFSSLDLSANNEMILFADYDKVLKRFHNSQTVMDYEYALSRSLVDTYLKRDGTPFTSEQGNETKTFKEIFENRDPRLAQTIMSPGFVKADSKEPYRMKLSLGGYVQTKFFPSNEDGITWNGSYNDLPIFRYAEILLINAEALAELGTLAQTDLDKSINILRNRVQMPPLNMGTANAGIDPVLADRYSNAGENGVLLEIRRERRVELATEGFRFDDLMRWNLGKLLEDSQQGIFIPAFGAYDVTGDGVEDVAILNSPDETGPIDGLSNKEDLSKFYVSDNAFYLENGNNGRIMFNTDRDNPKIFEEPKYYYRPIPRKEILLNNNLTQSPGWE